MCYLLNLVYLGLALCAAPVLVFRALTTGKYRRGWSAKLWGCVPRGNDHAPGDRIWLHAVSVGEVNLLIPVVKKLLAQRPDAQLFISSTTDTGYELAKSRFPEHNVFYCPLDFSWAVRRAVRQIRPSMLVLSELELWPNLIRIASSHGAKVVIINARLSETSFRGYHRFRFLLRPVFAKLTLVLAQNETYASRFLRLGVPPHRVGVTGSIKFDGARTDRDDPHVKPLRNLSGALSEHLIWIVGSTQHPEEQMALDVFKRLRTQHPQLRLVVVPRHRERFAKVAEIIDASNLTTRRRSELLAPADSWDQDTVLLIDSIGELSFWWAMADIATVGGSFGSRGGQNMLEPAGYGAAVCFGPNTRNFRDIVSQLLAAQAAVCVQDETELESFVNHCLRDSNYRRQLGQAAQLLVVGGQGAIDRTLEAILDTLPAKDYRQHAHHTARAA